jgi:hypothetical protein
LQKNLAIELLKLPATSLVEHCVLFRIVSGSEARREGSILGSQRESLCSVGTSSVGVVLGAGFDKPVRVWLDRIAGNNHRGNKR